MLPRRVVLIRTLLISCVLLSLATIWMNTFHFSNASIISASDQIYVPKDFKRVCVTVRIGGAIIQPAVLNNGSANVSASSHENSEEKKGNVSLLSVNKTLLVNFMNQLNKSSVINHNVVNPHPFKVVLSPRRTLCTQGDMFLLIYVHSSPNHFKQRSVIRQTWANSANFNDIKITLIFSMGWTASKSIQESIEFEHNQYGDILQEDYLDSYRNLTYKAISSLKWISKNCQSAKYILKTDDDIFVNIFSLINHVKGRYPIEKTMFCLVWRKMKVMRNPKSKWYIPKKEFKADYFPEYCSGSAFVFTNDLTYPMYKASLSTPFFWVDDFYMTGLLATRANVTRKQLASTYLLHEDKFMAVMSKPGGISYLFTHIHNLNKVQILWKKLLKMIGRNLV